MARLKFGVRLPTAGGLASTANILQVAKDSEKLGFDGVWLHDFFLWDWELNRMHVSCGSVEALREDQDPDFYESLTTLSYIAGATKSIKLGVTVLAVPLRHPVATAKQVANVDVLSGGRLIFGVGIGARRDIGGRDFEVLGISREAKYETTVEYLEAMKVLWRDRVASFNGKYVSFDGAVMFPKPIQKPHPPIWVGGIGEKALKLCAQVGNGWMPAGLTPEEYATKVTALTELGRSFGRSPTDFEITNDIYASVDIDSKKAHARVRGTFDALMIPSVGWKGRENVDRLEKASLVGDPGELVKQIEAFANSGVSYLEMKFVYSRMDELSEMLKLFAEEVLPSYR